MSASLTVVELRDLPAVKQGRLNSVLDWLPNLVSLTIALDYIDSRFGNMPPDFSPARWQEAKPLYRLTLLACGRTGDPSRNFTMTDLFTLIDERYLGRLRYLNIGHSTEWQIEDEVLGALESSVYEQDKESWLECRWHYKDVDFTDTRDLEYEQWITDTRLGRKMRPWFRLLKNR